MDQLGHAVNFPVNEMLLHDDGAGAAESVVVSDIGGTGQPSFVFSTPNLSDGTTLLSLPFALFQDGLSMSNANSVSANTTNIIIKQASQNNLTTSTIFLDAAQVALLSSGAGQVVLTDGDGLLEDGQTHSETQQIFLQVSGEPIPEEQKDNQGALVEQQTNNVEVGSLRNNVPPERRPVIPFRKRGPGRPRRDDSKIMPPSVKGVWFCQVCGKEFNKWPLLKKHVKSHSDDKPHRCIHCSASFNVPWNLKLHEATHVKPSASPLNCPACSRTFSRIASLKAHVMLHEEDESLFCAHCGDEFSTQCQLDEHMKTHELNGMVDPLSINQTIIDNNVWISDSSFDTQLTAVPPEHVGGQQTLQGQGPGVHQCKLCNVLFNKASLLRDHMKEHSKVKASLSKRNHKRNIDRSSFLHKCKNCLKGFKKPSQLVRHMRIHTGERPYKCDICTRAFNQKGSLQIHMTKHTGVKPFTCEFCSAGFRQRGNLRAHILRVHTIPQSGEQIFRCCECPCVFRKLGSLNAHVSRVHGAPASSSTNPNRRKKGGDGSGMEDELEGDVSDVMRRLAELDEATRALAGGDDARTDGGRPKKNTPARHVSSGITDSVMEETELVVRVNSAKEAIDPVAEGSGKRLTENKEDKRRRMEVPADILQQALEKSGLSDGKKTATVSPVSDSRMNTEMRQTEGEKSTIEPHSDPVSAGVDRNSSSCVLTLADKAHDGTVRRYNIKVRRANGIRWHQCTYCTKEFKKPSDLVRHIRIHTHEKPYKCYMCFRAFAVKSTLTVHLRIHSGLKSFQCTTCSKKFVSQSSLKVHQRLHSGLKPFGCHYCSMRFRTTGHRKTHESTHFRSKPKRLKKCFIDEASLKKVFLQDPIVVQQNPDPVVQADSKGLNESLQTTNPEIIAAMGLPEGTIAQQVTEYRPHQCNLCHAAFKKISHLKQHLSTHSGEKPFGCLSCNKAFVSRAVLRAHQKTHIPIMSPFRRPYECCECSRKFVTAGSCKRHMINTHEHLRKSMVKQTYLCPYCNAGPFNSNQACRKHILTHGEELLEAQQRQNEEALVNAQQLGSVEQDRNEKEDQLQSNIQMTEQSEQENMEIANMTEVTEIADKKDINKGDEQTGVSDDNNARNVVVTFSLDFQSSHGMDQQVMNPSLRTIEESVEQSTSQPVATISLTEQEHLTQESLRQIEQTLGSGMFGESDAIDPNASGGNSQASAHVKDPTLDFETHTISFDPSVFSNISLPSADALGLPSSLQPMDGISTTEPSMGEDTSPKDEDSKNRRKKIHKCTYCDRVFKKCSHMKQHLRSHTGEKPYQCLICLRMFVTMGTLKAHFRTHTGEKSFSCDHCGAHFTTNGSLTRHMFIHSDENRIYQCERCPQSFRTVGQWRRHWRSHENELIGRQRANEVPQVSVAGQVMTEEGAGVKVDVQQTQLSEEEVPNPMLQSPSIKKKQGRRRNNVSSVASASSIIRLSEEETSRLAMQSPSEPHLTLSERVLIASAAERERISEINDKERQLRLAPKLPHMCSHCPKSFRKPSDLARHIRTHTGERPYSCHKCGRRFTVKSTLDSHKLTHPPDGERVMYHPKYPCHVCGCLFATKGSLKVHMRLHTGARPFKCPHCELRFRTSGHRKAHLVTHLRSQSQMLDGMGVGKVRGRSRARRVKAVALEAMRTMDAELQDVANEEQEAEQHPSDVVEDWNALQANLGASGGFQLQLEGGSLSLQLDEGLLRQIHQQALGQEEVPKGHDDDDSPHHEDMDSSVANNAEEVEVPETLAFEAGDVGGLFSQPLEVILSNNKSLVGEVTSDRQESERRMLEKVNRAVREEGGVWCSQERRVGMMDRDGNVNLVIDGDFVIEEDGTLRQVVGGECVVLSALRDDDDSKNNSV